MVATVDIRTGEKTVLDYLLKPFNKAKEALREKKKPRNSGLFIGLLLLNSRYNLIFIMLYFIYGFYDCITRYF